MARAKSGALATIGGVAAIPTALVATRTGISAETFFLGGTTLGCAMPAAYLRRVFRRAEHTSAMRNSIEREEKARNPWGNKLVVTGYRRPTARIHRDRNKGTTRSFIPS